MTGASVAASTGLDLVYVGTLPPYPGGSGFSGLQLLTGLARSGHAVRALAPVTPETLEYTRRFDAAHGELDITRFVVPYFDVAPPIPPLAEYRALERQRIQHALPALIRTRTPQLILIGRESFAWDVPEIARAHDIPAVLMVRGGSRTARLLGGEWPTALAMGFLAECRKVQRLVTVGRHLETGFRGLGLDKIETIPNAVDLSQFAPRPKSERLQREMGIAPPCVVAMHVANLREWKRSGDLVESARATLQAEPRLAYVIVGDGPSRAAMEQACRDLGIADRFHYAGWVEYDRIPDFINMADVVIMPSQSEGLARVYVETQACGRVLIASDIPAAREVIVHGETGLLFRLADVADLTAKTVLAARDPALRARIGQKARERAIAFSLDAAVARYEAVLEGVVRLNGARQ